jgi:hypothetical protein
MIIPKRIEGRIKRVVDEVWENNKLKKGKDEISPIIFKNTPVSEEKDDVFGFYAQTSILEAAIKAGSTLIGIIGDYGSGKSSLTEISQKKFGRKYGTIKINLWDTFNKHEDKIDGKKGTDNGEETPIKSDGNVFSQSFLYQLAQGNKWRNINFARYINERQSRNYGKLSLKMSSHWALVWFLLAGLCLVLFFTGTNKEIFTSIAEVFNKEPLDKILPWVDFIKPFSYLILLLGIIFAYIGIRVGAFVFSLWDSQGKIEPEIGDVFENYTLIINRLLKIPFIGRKQIIYIEDLDRIDNKNFVIPFLKELYRFINLLPAWQKKKIVFIVSLKSESSLKNKLEKDIEEPSIYSKIFDYTLWIKPIHNENISDIVMYLLEQNQAPIKKVLGLTDDNLSRKILDDLYWILRGENLTIREMKDRLNEVFILYQTLKVRDNNSSVKLSKCCALAYLHRVYPEDYESLLKQEKILAQLIRNCYLYQKKDIDAINNIVTDVFGKLEFKNKAAFIEDITKMIFEGDIDEDFMMYFYNHPKNSYIKNIDEKEIADYILHPDNKYKNDEQVLEKINRVLIDKGGKIIQKILSDLQEREENLPIIIFEFEPLFSFSLNNFNNLTINSLIELLDDIMKDKDIIILLGKIMKYNLEENQKNDIITRIIPTIKTMLVGNKASKLIDIRISLIENIGDYISQFVEIFISSELPIIVEQELNLLNTNKQKLMLINVDLINSDNCSYIFNNIIALELTEEEYKLAEGLFLKTPDIENLLNIQPLLLDFLSKNVRFNDDLFTIILDNIDIESECNKLCSYMEKIDLGLLSKEQLIKIDDLEIKTIIDNGLLTLLESRKLLRSALLSRSISKKLDEFDFKGDGIIPKLLFIAKDVYTKYPDEFLSIRFAAFKQLQHEDSELCTLFMNDFPLIKNYELELIEDTDHELSMYLYHPFIDDVTYMMLSNYCNNKHLSGDKLYSFFITLFEPDEDNDFYISDISVIKLILSAINFKEIHFESMSDNQKKRICEIFSPTYLLTTAIGCIEFMKTINCLMPMLEEIILKEIDDRKISSSQYIGIVNDIQKPTDSTIEIIRKIHIDQSLVPLITDKLYENGYYIRYIIGKSLLENSITLEDKVPLINYYKALISSANFANLCLERNDILLEFARHNLLNEKFPNDKMHHLYVIRQPIFLIKYILNNLKDNVDEIKNYLHSIKDIDTEQEVGEFIELITSEEYIGLLNDRELFYYIYHRMWNRILKQRLTLKVNRILKPEPKYSAKGAGDYDPDNNEIEQGDN